MNFVGNEARSGPRPRCPGPGRGPARDPFAVAVQGIIKYGCVVLSVLSFLRISSLRGAEHEDRWPSVGMQGRLEAALPASGLTAKPVTERSLLILRIADARPHGRLTYYEFHYVGLVPGEYDLVDYLGREDGSPIDDLPPLRVRVTGLLPESHQGELIDRPFEAVDGLGGYRRVTIGLGVLWGVGLAGLLVWVRRRKGESPVLVEIRPPTLAQKLQPLVEAAAAGRLSAEGKAELELTLLHCWRERLGLENCSPEEAMARLQAHPEAGELVRHLEDWLHRPPGAVTVDVAGLLAPYREREEETENVGGDS